MARRKQAQPRPYYFHMVPPIDDDDNNSSNSEDGSIKIDCKEEPEDEEEESIEGIMPPTDGDVAGVTTDGGDSNAALAANSALSVPFSCGFCQRSFPRLSLLKKHEQAHSDEMPFRCDFCARLFKHKRSRDRHVKLHTGDKKYRCQHCEAAFSRSDHLKIHVKTHDTRKPFQCTVCQRGYSTAAALTSHMLNHRRESGSRCGSLCSSTSTTSEASLSSLSSSVTARSSSSGRTSSSSTASPLASPVASSPMPTIDPAHAILAQPPPTSVTPPPEVTSSPLPSTLMSRATRTEVTAMDVSKKEAGTESLTATKTPPIALQCPYCAKESFSSLAALSLHVQTLHGPLTGGQHQETSSLAAGLDLYGCQLCSLRFGNLPALQQHTLSAHSLADVLRLYCPPPPSGVVKNDGSRTQSFPTDLSCQKRRYDQSETEQRYSCPHCPVEFSQSEAGLFPSHVANHLISSWREFSCSSCTGKTFPSADELQKHLLDVHAHHLYRCSLCQETFDSKVSIQVHLAVQHSSESKLYRCTACPASDVFQSETEFHAHVASVHTAPILSVKQPKVQLPVPAVALLQCPLCPLSFPVEFLLERHIHLNHQDQLSFPSTTQPKLDKVIIDQHPDNSSGPATVLNLSLHCAYCGETCKSRSDLESHMKTAHHPPGSANSSTAAPTLITPTGRIKCNICDELFPSASVLAEHKLSHCKVSGAAVCAQCRVPLPTEEAFFAHLQAPPHGGPNATTPPLTCLVCRQTLNLPLEVGLHARFHTSGNVNTTPELYPCCFCHRQLESTQLIANGMAPGGQQTYICKDCLKHNQMTLLQPPRRYQCIKCQEIFASEMEIQAHVASHLLSEGSLHPCRLCARQFDTPFKLQTHLIEHTFAGCPAFTCYLCGCLFTAAANLQRHMLDQHGGAAGLRPYDCSLCHHKFFFRAELDNHLLSHVAQQQQNEAEIRQEQTEGERREEDEEEEEKQEIDVLSKEEELCNSLNGEEEGGEETMDDEEDNISVTSSSHSSEITLSDAQKAANAIPEGIISVEEPNGKHSDMSDSTDSCSSSSSMNNKKDEHQPTGDSSPGGNTSFRCDRCNQSFPCLSNLQGHIRIHTQSRRFTCPESSCGKEFALRRNLHIHMRSHTGDRPYSCPICPKRFARKENRKAHLKLHSGVKPFRCDVCDKAFARKSHLIEHGRTHSSPSSAQGAEMVKSSGSEAADTPTAETLRIEHHPK